MGKFTKLVDTENSFSFMSMIDVVFLLLIFFMVSAKFIEKEELMEAFLPSDGIGRPMDEVVECETLMIFVKDNEHLRRSNNINIRGSRKATFYLASRQANPVPDPMHLLPMLKRLSRSSDMKVIIAPFDEGVRRDQEVPFFNVMNVMDVCKKAGLVKISFQAPMKASL